MKNERRRAAACRRDGLLLFLKKLLRFTVSIATVILRFFELLLGYAALCVTAMLIAYFVVSFALQLLVNSCLPHETGKAIREAGVWAWMLSFASWLTLMALSFGFLSKQSRWDRKGGWYRPRRFGAALAGASLLLAVPVLLVGMVDHPVFNTLCGYATVLFHWTDGLLTPIGGRLFLLAVNGVLFYWFYTRGSGEKKMKKVRY